MPKARQLGGKVTALTGFTQDESRRVTDLMMGFAHSPQCAGPMNRAMSEIFGDVDNQSEDFITVVASEACQSVFHTWFMFDRPITEDGHLLVDVFLGDDSLGLTPGQRRYLEQMRSSHMRPYEVLEVVFDAALVLRDLWNDEVVRVSERVATYYARPATTLFARVIQGSEGEREMHGVTSFPRAEMLDLVHHLKLTHRAMRERQPDLSDQEFFKDVMPWIQRSWLASFRSPPRKRKTSPREERMPSGDRILQLKIALEDVRPQVWRRLLVPERMTLGTLSKTLERVMGWESYHLHEFEIDGISYGMPDPDYPSDVRNERGRKLANFDFAAGSYFVYRYDFGDGWRHRVRVERVLEPQPGARYPVCTAGSRACPPEDVGGTGGYAEFLRVLRSPKHEEHEHFREWSRRRGHDFDPKAFDFEEANAKLRSRVLLPGQL